MGAQAKSEVLRVLVRIRLGRDPHGWNEHSAAMYGRNCHFSGEDLIFFRAGIKRGAQRSSPRRVWLLCRPRRA